MTDLTWGTAASDPKHTDEDPDLPTYQRKAEQPWPERMNKLFITPEKYLSDERRAELKTIECKAYDQARRIESWDERLSDRESCKVQVMGGC